ncbi:unnamed protein product [Rotaria magnacalcarata]|uniref:Uncharacterized protein n=1 Tax=Rotaria magnacalcarata TaxID=392030 RepID=A0A816PD86_9BILA|nr:unnamed protein product [Rotaria magnacalcarata]CAF2084196.1 unnamed protein product [Rotaria magnacalcarata]CAF3851302.1 unnamed protein product [Rotaria magnacalcarata]CAF4260880.1 unnamed protein product [Rotaria magnacalcarata]
MLSMALLSILVLTIVRYHLSIDKNKFKKEYMALLINTNKMIEMVVPINKQKQQLVGQSTVKIRTETFHSSLDTHEDYYESMLSTNDLPYYSVRETIFQPHPRSTLKLISDSKGATLSTEPEIGYI